MGIGGLIGVSQNKRLLLRWVDAHTANPDVGSQRVNFDKLIREIASKVEPSGDPR